MRAEILRARGRIEIAEAVARARGAAAVMLAAVAAGLPAVAAAESFDLRDVDGRSLLNPVRNQHLCAHSLPHRTPTGGPCHAAA
eukprot:COSAG04_NODE_25262_length_310_cov_0.715640_1_plen_83_part_10